jgi:uncharacterized protein (DUF2235 family)
MSEQQKRLIVLCDGTWNNPEQKSVTNVVKMARAILPVDRQGLHQVVFYDWGVGSEELDDRLSGGIAGLGLDKNIQDAYRFLVHNYAKGDEIFLFGFSRGAYTARSAAGFIRNAGILKKQYAKLIPAAYKMYRTKAKADVPRAVDFRAAHSHEVRIKFIGVWDTVGALGIPLKVMEDSNKKKYEFHDTSLSRIIDHACHSLAIDEKRRDFAPTMWVKKPGAQQTLEQVWFAGVHCDVGGGYKEHGLSDITLKWMVKQAEKRNLAFDHSYLNALMKPNSLQDKHTSWRGGYWLKGRHFRPIGELPDAMEKIHSSVRERYKKYKKNGKRYRPKKLVQYLKNTPEPAWTD